MTTTSSLKHSEVQSDTERTPLLSGISSPADIRSFSDAQLISLAAEIRDDLVNNVSKTLNKTDQINCVIET